MLALGVGDVLWPSTGYCPEHPGNVGIPDPHCHKPAVPLGLCHKQRTDDRLSSFQSFPSGEGGCGTWLRPQGLGHFPLTVPRATPHSVCCRSWERRKKRTLLRKARWERVYKDQVNVDMCGLFIFQKCNFPLKLKLCPAISRPGSQPYTYFPPKEQLENVHGPGTNESPGPFVQKTGEKCN